MRMTPSSGWPWFIKASQRSHLGTHSASWRKCQRYFHLSYIVESCGSLLTSRNGVIYFVHQSAKDYLNDKEAKTIFPSSPTEAHHDIFLRSLVTMCKLRQDIYDLRHPAFSIGDLKVPVSDPLASVRYSCTHWVNHLCDAKNRGSGGQVIDYGEVFQFLRHHFLCWVEALSLTQQAPRSINSIQRLQALLQVNLFNKV